MASLYWFLVGVLFFCLYAVAESSFVEVVCDPISMGQVNHQSLLKCEVKLTQPIPDLEITLVVWKKKGDESPIALYNFKNEKPFKEQPGFTFPNRNMNDFNVSLLISNIEVKHQGIYTCMVMTSSGSSNSQTELKVMARYSNLTVRSINAYKDPKVSQTLICEATGGYPEGNLRWIVENNTDWTKSSKQTATKMENGLLKMHSELPLLKGSTFDRYSCVLFNSSGGRQESVLFTLHNQGKCFSNTFHKIHTLVKD
uniref:Ig-like domain-containing protein n=1 Tax=Cyprinodon variegatus TaxID=28743 RepID=A0A3Q2CNK0_CYPVA